MAWTGVEWQVGLQEVGGFSFNQLDILGKGLAGAGRKTKVLVWANDSGDERTVGQRV